MDSGEGYFTDVSTKRMPDLPVHLGGEGRGKVEKLFYIGQELVINKSKFRVTKLEPKTMTLKILPQEKGEE